MFRGNSCFDPDYTGTGHQPRYFDQYAAVYQKYKVTASSCKVEMINFSADSSVIFAVIPNTEILTFTNWQLVSELPLAKVSEILPVASRYPFNIKDKQTTAKVCGLNQFQVNDEDWSALTSANPSPVS